MIAINWYIIQPMKLYQSTFVMIKPDAIDRNLVGRIISRFEDAGLILDSLKISKATIQKLQNNYLPNINWFEKVGNKVLENFRIYKLDIKKYLNTRNPEKIGEMIYKWNLRDLRDKNILAMVVSGPHVIDRVKQLVGVTEPLEAMRGTIRGDWCTDSIVYANTQRRSISSLVHRSSDVFEAKRQIGVWFQ
mgnify:CR=1 FL=1